MNEYTRKEEVRATILASVILVLCIAVAFFRLVTVQGRLVPDENARKLAQESEVRVTKARPCTLAGDKLGTEIEVFKKLVKAAQQQAESQQPPTRPRYPKPKPPEAKLEWKWGQQTHKQAKVLADCREPTEAKLGARADLSSSWDAMAKAAALTPPGTDETEQTEKTKALLALLETIEADKIAKVTQEAEAAYKKVADQDRERAETAMVREALPEGLLPRRAAVGIGVALTVFALLISYISVRVASMRRQALLLPLRDAARTGSLGAQTAAILKVAAAHNGGEPGIVAGAALGGLIAALLLPRDADVFTAGVMGGLLVGLALQWAFRLAIGANRWRARAAELSEVEKPAIPIVLVLSGVNPGLEAQFIEFLRSQPPADAAAAVEKLAAQAEERILAAADAQAQGHPGR